MTNPQQIKLANQLPLNRAAKKFLPKDWQNDLTELHVLSLMRWGLENGQEISPKGPDHPVPEQVEAMLVRLSQADPKKAMRFLTEVEGDVVLTEDGLLRQETPEDAASLLLETLYDNMVATAP